MVRAEARCPPGEHVTGGGYMVRTVVGNPPNSRPAVNVIENRPFRVPGGIDEWLVSGVNLDSQDWTAGVLQAYAICTATPPPP